MVLWSALPGPKTPNVGGNRRAALTLAEDQAVCRRVRLTVRLGRIRLQILRSKTGVLGDTRQHLRADLVRVVKGEHEFGPTATAQRAVRTRLTFNLPPSPKQRG